MMPRALALAVVLVLLYGVASAQSATPVQVQAPPGGVPLPWMAVSIHPMDPAKADNASAGDQPNGIDEKGVPLASLISQAYNFGIMPMRDDEIEGLPPWAKSARYDVEARVDPEDVLAFRKLSNLSTAATIAAFKDRQYTGEMLMQQALLTERFHLKSHWVTREHSVYLLTLASGGPHLTPAADPEHGSMSFSSGTITAKGVPLVFFASVLEMPAERKIVDKTGLTEAYDLSLHFSPQNLSASSETNTDPDLFTALQEQLGLKLQSSKQPIPVLVIDHIEEPTPN